MKRWGSSPCPFCGRRVRSRFRIVLTVKKIRHLILVHLIKKEAQP